MMHKDIFILSIILKSLLQYLLEAMKDGNIPESSCAGAIPVQLHQIHKHLPTSACHLCQGEVDQVLLS